MTQSESEQIREGGGRRLPSERWDIIKSQVVQRAHALRMQVLREFAGWLANRPMALLHRMQARWARHAAVRELQRLDNRTLRDMGIARSEIEYLVAGGDAERRAPKRAAAASVPRRERRHVTPDRCAA